MKKVLFLLLSISIAAGAMAQTDPPKKAEMKDLKTDVREKKAAKHKVNKDLGHLRLRKATKDQKVVRAENKDINKDAKRLKNRGVEHPVTKAKRQVKVEDDAKKDHTN
ncbi:hypothetical protein ACX0G9_01330 [Flavitalea flava]